MTDRTGYPVAEIARFESRGGLHGTVTFSVLLAAAAVLFTALFPSVAESGVDFEQYLESLPPALQAVFGNAPITTIEGFLAIEVYQFIWLILLGLYFAYLGGGLIAGPRERGELSLVLAGPVPRRSVVLGRFATVVVAALVVNAVVGLSVYATVVGIGESIDPVDLAAVHLLSVPYLLACAAIGTVASTLLSSADYARRAAIGLVFVLFVLESLLVATDVDWLGVLSPTYHYDPVDVLVRSQYDLGGALVLLGVTVVLLGVAVLRFERSDLG